MDCKLDGLARPASPCNAAPHHSPRGLTPTRQALAWPLAPQGPESLNEGEPRSSPLTSSSALLYMTTFKKHKSSEEKSIFLTYMATMMSCYSLPSSPWSIKNASMAQKPMKKHCSWGPLNPHTCSSRETIKRTYTFSSRSIWRTIPFHSVSHPNGLHPEMPAVPERGKGKYL
ncbi:hypothetical protein BJV74DRAFT_304523 [Russula compacta]|nr:hypothetical protein BJV74DRAFT_304523 [Russula compacta]